MIFADGKISALQLELSKWTRVFYLVLCIIMLTANRVDAASEDIWSLDAKEAPDCPNVWSRDVWLAEEAEWRMWSSPASASGVRFRNDASGEQSSSTFKCRDVVFYSIFRLKK